MISNFIANKHTPWQKWRINSHLTFPLLYAIILEIDNLGKIMKAPTLVEQSLPGIKAYGRNYLENWFEVKDLEKLVTEAKDAYYNTGEPIVDDATYDMIEDVLREKSPESRALLGIRQSIYADMFETIKKNGVNNGHLDLSIKDLERLILDAKHAYYNTGDPIIDDADYDVLEDMLRAVKPDSVALGVGAITLEKTTLPCYMGSLDKLKDVSKSTFKGDVVITAKIDGVSMLYVDGNKLYTRGNGVEGQDISHLITYLGLPHISKGTIIRGELVMDKDTFASKYAGIYKNARNMVSGMITRKTIMPEQLSDTTFIAFELLAPRNTTFGDDLEKLASRFTVPWNTTIPTSAMTNERLTKMLIRWKETSKFEIDGLVVNDDSKFYPVNTEKNPKYAFAFKSALATETAVATVVDVEWNVSRLGQVKPTVIFEPVELSGATLSRATVHHAKYVWMEGIGPGAKITVTRSGDVIPYVMDVIKSTQAKMPPDGTWKWDETRTNILTTVHGTPQQLRSQLEFALRGLGVENMGPARVMAVVEAGYHTIGSLLYATSQDLIPVIGPSMGGKLPGILQEQWAKADLLTMMHVSGAFGQGIGKRKLKKLLTTYPEIVTYDSEHIGNLPGPENFSDESMATKVAPGIARFQQFMRDLNMETPTHETPKETRNDLTGKVFAFSGIRDKDLAAEMENLGATVAGSLTKAVTDLVVKDVNSTHGKVKTARERGVNIMHIDDARQLVEVAYF